MEHSWFERITELAVDHPWLIDAVADLQASEWRIGRDHGIALGWARCEAQHSAPPSVPENTIVPPDLIQTVATELRDAADP